MGNSDKPVFADATGDGKLAEKISRGLESLALHPDVKPGIVGMVVVIETASGNYINWTGAEQGPRGDNSRRLSEAVSEALDKAGAHRVDAGKHSA